MTQTQHAEAPHPPSPSTPSAPSAEGAVSKADWGSVTPKERPDPATRHSKQSDSQTNQTTESITDTSQAAPRTASAPSAEGAVATEGRDWGSVTPKERPEATTIRHSKRSESAHSTNCHFERSEAEPRNLTNASATKDLSTPLRSGRDDNAHPLPSAAHSAASAPSAEGAVTTEGRDWGSVTPNNAITPDNAFIPTTPTWLNTAVFYEIYPQSFADSNGDGIGDIRGIIDHLDYVRNLGCNALWLNPLFDSPFKDAGYDVRDYTRVAPRYGTNDDLIALFVAAHERGIHVLLDLVPGHTSEEHEWFRASSAAPSAASAPSAEGAVSEADWGSVTPKERPTLASRYIWTDSWIAGGDGLPFIGGETPRDGTYIINFFKCQPALNYGFAHPRQSWQHAALGPEALATCDAMIDVMRFWLSRGADGFRVDMADSLVKHDDEGKPYTIRTWQYMFSKIRPEFPAAAFVSEWGRPYESMQAGFDMDFYLDWRWDGKPNGYNMLLRNTDTPFDHDGDLSYFNADSGSSIKPFLDQYLPQLRDCERVDGRFDLISCNHDTRRFAPRLTERERKIAFGMLLTMPGCPFVYYGDEIGMRYRDLPTKEGGYTRTGSRTPMQWDGDLPNLGFSCAPADALYLPVESAGDAGSNSATCESATTPAVESTHDCVTTPASESEPFGLGSPAPIPTVASESARADSLYHWIKSLLALRANSPALQSNAAFEPVAAPESGRVFAYLRTPLATSDKPAPDIPEAPTSRAISGESASTVNPDAPIPDTHVPIVISSERSESRNLPLLIAMNPGRATETVTLPPEFIAQSPTIQLELGTPTVAGTTLTLPPQSFVILG